MKKLENESELVKEAIRIGMIYAKKRGTVQFEDTDSAKLKVEYVYRLLVHDKVIQPLAKGQEDQPHMKHKLAHWVLKNLPDTHPLKK
jgi:hypothetical protein